MLPEANEHYKDVSYWNRRYSDETSKDWLLDYDALKELFLRVIKKNDKILMLGCGNSLLSEQMAQDGFLQITNIDYSPVVISKMQVHCDVCSKLQWIQMDARNLCFDDASFDVVLEKATIDSFLVDEKDAWNISEQNSTLIQGVLSEVSRVLKPGGRLLSVSFSQPHFRGPLYAKRAFQWSLRTEELGSDFHHYVYIMTKGEALSQESFFTYTPPTTVTVNHNKLQSTAPPENDSDFLSNIEI